MAIKFYGLTRELDKKGMNKGELQKAIKASSRTIAKLFSNEYVALDVIDRVCQVLGCQPGDIMEFVPDKPTAKDQQQQTIDN